MNNLSTSGKVTRAANSAAAAQTAVTSSAIDTRGFGAACFYCLIGSIADTGTVSMKAQQSSDDGSSDAYSDLTGTAVAATASDDNKVLILEINNPVKRYLKVVVTRGTADSVIDGILCVQHRAKNLPVSHAASVVASELHASPTEGTA